MILYTIWYTLSSKLSILFVSCLLLFRFIKRQQQSHKTKHLPYSDVFLALATGIRVRSCDLRWNKLAELSYPVPPLNEQNAIVKHIDSVLSKADAVIADKKAQLATLDEYKKSLIFEYVTGKKEVPVS